MWELRDLKLLYKKEKYKKYNCRKSRRANKRLQKRKKKKYNNVGQNKFVEKFNVSAPYVFSIIENCLETIEFFRELEEKARINRNLYIDIKKTTKITPEAILYLLSLLEYITKDKTRKITVRGNAPKNLECKKIFLCSGFYDYVDSVYSTPPDIDILSIKSDNKVDGKIAKQVIDFACSKLSLKEGKTTRAFYTTILECMGNTTQHAYDKVKHAKWWLVAYHDKKTKTVCFAILDNGKGIPETVRKKFTEKFLSTPDVKLIKSTLSGDFRTATRLKYRGKGLPKINEFMKKGLIQNLTIVSNKGFYQVDNDIEEVLVKKFKGTLIYWSFTRGRENAN